MEFLRQADKMDARQYHVVDSMVVASPCCVQYPHKCSSSADTVVVIPTYNERENITSMIIALNALPVKLDILVVDDNSPDGTAEIVEWQRRAYKNLHLIRRPGKGGLGSAYKAGFAFALQRGYRYICQMDADFSHDPNDIPRLLNACRNGTDIAIGSRYVRGGRIEGWPFSRWLLSRGANILAQAMLRIRISDLTGGFKCFKREALERIDVTKVSSEGYIFQVEMNCLALRKGLRVKQVPICFNDRQAGTSKMGKNEAREGIKQLVRLLINKASILDKSF